MASRSSVPKDMKVTSQDVQSSLDPSKILYRGRYNPIVPFTSLPWPYRLLCTPVLGRRVGRTQMEESKTLGNGSLNVYGQIQKNTME